jgi:cytochrome c5
VSTQDSDFYRTLTLVLAALFVFFVVIIVAALVITDSDDSAKTATDPRIAAKVDELITPVGQVNTDASAAAAPAPAAGGAIDGPAMYQSNCFACHGTGAAGAPKVGDKAAWKARIAQGTATLYEHAIKGFQGKSGVMPAKGGHAELSDEAVQAIVDHMVSNSK